MKIHPNLNITKLRLTPLTGSVPIPTDTQGLGFLANSAMQY